MAASCMVNYSFLKDRNTS